MTKVAYHSMYLNELDPCHGQEAVAASIKALSKISFDAIAFTGMSGALVAPSVAYALNKPLIMVRKPNDGSHAVKQYNVLVEGALEVSSYVIIDDFYCTGKTLHYIVQSIKEQRNKILTGTARANNSDICCVGIFLYRYFELFTAQNRPNWAPKKLTDLLQPYPQSVDKKPVENTSANFGLDLAICA
jgi:hypoxanthine phosphoribosyltransferase